MMFKNSRAKNGLMKNVVWQFGLFTAAKASGRERESNATSDNLCELIFSDEMSTIMDFGEEKFIFGDSSN